MRMNEENQDWPKESEVFALLKSKPQIGQDAMSCEDYITMQGEDIIDVECCIGTNNRAN